ncbi:TetR/AcrR family transcriptional regulator [Paenibacillus macerans]|uniref:TetR/AcrR family transcriptional regulator n=1 Tax=Paenibacillus macerans TaxID=44252 RepID=UPI003D312ECA
MSGNGNEEKVRLPRQSRSIKTKESILKAAMELFSTKGYHNTNTKEIAAMAGVSTGSFYSYFVDKRAVFIEALKLYNKEFKDRLYQSLGKMDLEHSDKYAALSRFIDGMVDAHQVFNEFHSELALMYHSDPEVKALMDEQYQGGRLMTEMNINKWKDQLRVTDINAASIVVFETLNRLVDVIVFEQHDLDPARLKKESVDMIISYLFQP